MPNVAFEKISQIFAAEFGAFVHLGLSIRFPETHVSLMTTRLLKIAHLNMKKYLGDDGNRAYKDVRT